MAAWLLSTGSEHLADGGEKLRIYASNALASRGRPTRRSSS